MVIPRSLKFLISVCVLLACIVLFLLGRFDTIPAFLIGALAAANLVT